MTYQILQGDCIASLRTLPEKSVHTCVTSPPYFGLRDYGHDGQIGLEASPDAFVAKLVEVFREVRRVLRDDGTVWLNLGDSYAANQSNNGGYSAKSTLAGFTNPNTKGRVANDKTMPRSISHGAKPKDLLGIPWRVAFALQSDGWYLRQDIIWHKPNPMPESVRDRCTKAHEYIFLLSKSERYYFDSEAMQEPAIHAGKTVKTNGSEGMDDFGDGMRTRAGFARGVTVGETRNRRSVWTVATKPYKGAHFATFPPDLIRPCILAGCPKDGIVVDPFGGSGTTAQVALEEGRSAILCELNPEYITLAHQRMKGLQVRLL